MLCQFIFKNFKSYRDETVFDLQATSAKEHFDSLLVSENNKTFLPVSVIYGPNAGGKSGALEALGALISLVMHPIEYMKNESNQFLFSMKRLMNLPFAFDKTSRDAPMEFTIFFHNKGFEYRYCLAVCENDVVSESLYRKYISGKNPAKIYERDADGIKLGSSINKKTINTNVNTNMPFISFLAINYNLEIINSAVEWFSNCIFINDASTDMYRSIILIPEMKGLLLKALNDMDISISDYHIKYKANEKDGEEILDTIYLSRNIDGHEYYLDIALESGGTTKLFGLLPLILISIYEGRLLIIDELDASIHPKLLRYIIRLFTDITVNKNRAQLLFTSHDVTTMKSDVFRRDEIWFASKDDDGVSEIYSLHEIRNTDGKHIKAGAAFDKQYMDGRYGADPYLSEMLSLHWGDE